MPKPAYRFCWNCGADAHVVGPLSHTRLCPTCSRERLEENMDGIHTRSGMAYARQQIGTVRAAVRDPAIVNALINAGVFGYQEEIQC